MGLHRASMKSERGGPGPPCRSKSTPDQTGASALLLCLLFPHQVDSLFPLLIFQGQNSWRQTCLYHRPLGIASSCLEPEALRTYMMSRNKSIPGMSGNVLSMGDHLAGKVALGAPCANPTIFSQQCLVLYHKTELEMGAQGLSLGSAYPLPRLHPVT